MVAPVLTTYQYQYKDGGVLLNGGASLPFIDVQKVSGLDLPPIDSIVTEYDSQHGGYVRSKFTSTRTMIIEGILYANPTTIDTTLDTLHANFIPDDIDYPFYYLGAGITQRYIMAKAVGLNYDVDTLRAYGACAIQIQLQAGDPRKYIDNADQVMTNNVNYNISNPGNVATFPKFTVTGAMTQIVFTNNTTGKSVTLVTTRIAGDVTIVDFRTRSVTINGVKSSAVLSSPNWWDIAAGGTTSIKYVVTGGPPTSVVAVTKQGWL